MPRRPRVWEGMSSDALHPAVPALTWVPPLSPPGLVAAWPDSPGLLPPPPPAALPWAGGCSARGALVLAQGAGGGNRRSSFPTLSCASGDGDQRSCCALRRALPPLAALRRVAPPLVPLSRVAGSAPLPGTTPSPRPLGLSPISVISDPGREFPPARLPLSLRGHPLPSPGPVLPAAQHGVSASHGATHGLGPEAGAADPRRVPHPADPGVRPLQPAALERPRHPGGKRARAR